MIEPDKRESIAQAAADDLEEAARAGRLPAALVGFDGFLDAIYDVVDRRRDMSPRGYERIRTISAFSARVAAAAGRSANVELVRREERFGGNGPLMAGALGALGAAVSFLGAVGREEDPAVLHPAYEPLAARCHRVAPIAPTARTDALEFDDGKIMFNHPANVQAVTWERLMDAVGLDGLIREVDGAALIGITNWTIVGGVESIWEGLIRDVLPKVRPAPRRLFIDLSDPAKRTDSDIARAIGILRRLDTLIPVTLGLNLAEAERIAAVVKVGKVSIEGPSLADSAGDLRKAIGVCCVVVHPRDGAAGALADQVAWFDGPFTQKPRLSTGAGDHFNAGFALGQASGLALAECLATGCACSGAYVRDGASPGMDRLCRFLRRLPQPEQDAGID